MTLDTPAQYLRPSNLVTYLSIAFALCAMVAAGYASGGRAAHLAGGFLVLSALADIFDGKFARLFARSDKQAAFGAQLDSLADAVVFGATPVICLFLLVPRPSFLWVAALAAASWVYLVCVVTRLGFYNLNLSASDSFVGVPTTVMNLLWSGILFFDPGDRLFLVLVPALLVVAGGLMVAPIRVARPRTKGLAALAALALVLLGLHLAAS